MNLLIDTNVFLNVIRSEPGLADASEELLNMVHRGVFTGLASSVAIMETKWVLHEKREYGKAARAVSLMEDVVEFVSLDKEIAKEAMDIKIVRRLELLDSVHVSSAVMRGAVLVTRDDELRRRVEDLVPVMTPEQVLEKSQGRTAE
jgi:predicted nucleic acid-binding protein